MRQRQSRIYILELLFQPGNRRQQNGKLSQAHTLSSINIATSGKANIAGDISRELCGQRKSVSSPEEATEQGDIAMRTCSNNSRIQRTGSLSLPRSHLNRRKCHPMAFSG
jgi:hypothetical protein